MRKDRYGAFLLCHDSREIDQPSLLIHINQGVAYLHYLPDNRGRRAGYQPTGMTPDDTEYEVNFLMTTGAEADSFTMPRETLVSVDVAYKAAEEFLREPVLPRSVTWFTL